MKKNKQNNSELTIKFILSLSTTPEFICTDII